MKLPGKNLLLAFSLICPALGCASQARDKSVDLQRTADDVARRYIIHSADSSSRNCKLAAELGVDVESYYCPNPSAAEFIAAIPRLGARSEIIRKGGDVGPWPTNFQWYEFTPEIVGDHLVVAKQLRCNCSCEHMECSYAESGGVFDSDPIEHFTLGPGTRRDEAFDAVRLYRAGKIEPSDWFKPWDNLSNLHVEGVSDHAFDDAAHAAIKNSVVPVHALILSLSSEACGFAFHVRIVGAGQGKHLLVLGPIDGGCV